MEEAVIPSLLVVAVVLGLLIHDRASVWRSVAVGAVLPVPWGIVVGVGDASATTAAGGAALGLANVVAGAAVGAAMRAMWSWACLAAHGRTAPPR
jgi:hypothetical protein